MPEIIRPSFNPRPKIAAHFSAAIGHTPLIRLRHLSEATGCEILGKAEFMNPGGSVKDRAALGLIEDAERSGALASVVRRVGVDDDHLVAESDRAHAGFDPIGFVAGDDAGRQAGAGGQAGPSSVSMGRIARSHSLSSRVKPPPELQPVLRGICGTAAAAAIGR